MNLSETHKFYGSMAGLMAIACLWLYGLFLLPDAMYAEKKPSRAVAAGSWKHLPGVYEYQDFISRN